MSPAVRESPLVPFDLSVPGEAEGTATWSWNVATGEVAWSEGIEQVLFGLPRGTFGGTFAAYLALVHPDDRAYFQAVIARTLESEAEYSMSHRAVWPDGSIHWIDGRGQLTRDADGRPALLTGVAWTTAARRLAQARLRHLRSVQSVASAVRKELLRVRSESEAFEHACAIAVEHGHLRFVWIGTLAPGGQRLVPVARAGVEDGYLAEPAVASALSVHGNGPVGRAVREGRPVVASSIATDPDFAPWREVALARGYRACAAFPLRCRGEVSAALLIYAAEESRFDADQIDLLQGLADDIGFTLDGLDAAARRRAAEHALRESEERFRALFEQAIDGIFLADADGRVLEVNAAACEMAGYARHELIGRLLSELLDPAERERPALLIGRAAGSRIAGERRLRRKDGTVLDTEVAAIVLADGRVQGYARDVTGRKVVQERLILADRLAALGRLAAGVAHEVNNPLAYVVLNLESIERITVSASATCSSPATASALEEVRAAAAEARDGAERVRVVVRSLGAFSRHDEGGVGSVDVHRVLDGAVRLSENRVRPRGHVVKRYAATRPVRGNELRLGQVFVNLLLNAADALPEGAPAGHAIELSTRDEADRVVIDVRDTGVGVPPELLGRIFDPFFTTKRVGEGTGLGLSISHGIVSSFGGTIVVDSRLGEGTTFRVSLLAEGASAGATPARATQPSEARLRLLIVDDEPRLAHGLAALLERHAVTVATRGTEALALALAYPYDCIVCDLTMPDLSGMDIHAGLTRAGRGLERRMIFMTGGTFTARAREFVSGCDNAVLDKPFPVRRVEEAIAALLAREGLDPRP